MSVAPLWGLCYEGARVFYDMPTYEYHCEKCKKNFDFIQSMRDEPVTICPEAQCQQKKWGKGRVKRQVGSGAGLIFKGSGFYITDYRSAGYQEAAKKDKPVESGAKSGDGGSKTGDGGSKTGGDTAKKPEAKKPAEKTPTKKD